jgi:general secretion pathway protein J
VKHPPGAGQAGFTLIELMISLGLFALIAVAGLALVEGIIKVQSRTEKRFDRLADLQRTMFVVTSDLDQIAAGRVQGSGGDLSFTRAAPGAGGAAVPMRYVLAAGALVRRIGPGVQPVLTGVRSARFRYWDGAWADRWPLSDKDKDRWPRAIALEMQVADPGGAIGSLRRVVALPVRPKGDQP